MVAERIERLEGIVAEFNQIAEAEAAEAADRAAFDPRPAFDRHRRHQASLGRELLRTVDTLRRLLKEEKRPSADVDRPQPTDEPSSPSHSIHPNLLQSPPQPGPSSENEGTASTVTTSEVDAVADERRKRSEKRDEQSQNGIDARSCCT